MRGPAGFSGPHHTDKTITVLKNAALLHEDDRWFFTGTSHHEMRYGVEADATCPHAEHRHVPDPDCTCGFYAYRISGPRPAGLDQGWQRHTPPGRGLPRHYAELLVELSGRVIIGTNGYRAEHQTVLAARLIPRLDRCTGTSPGQPEIIWDSPGQTHTHTSGEQVLVGRYDWGTPQQVITNSTNQGPIRLRVVQRTIPCPEPATYHVQGDIPHCTYHAIHSRYHLKPLTHTDLLDQLRHDLPTDWTLDTLPHPH